MSKGRPVGARSRPQFHEYTTEEERRDYVKWVKKQYKLDPQLAKWYGDQLFGKALQSVEMSGSLAVEPSEELIKKANDAITEYAKQRDS